MEVETFEITLPSVEWRCSVPVRSRHSPPENKPSESLHSHGRDAVLSVRLGQKGDTKGLHVCRSVYRELPGRTCGVWSESETERYSDRQTDANPQLIALTVPVKKHLWSIEGELVDKSLPPTHYQNSAKIVFGGHHAEQPIPADCFVTGPVPPTETNTIQFAWT